MKSTIFATSQTFFSLVGYPSNAGMQLGNVTKCFWRLTLNAAPLFI